MKKLMFAAALVGAFAASAAQGINGAITSTSIVGYANDVIDQHGGWASVITPQFIGLGSDGKISLDSIKCPESAANKITLQILNGDGSTKTSYLWGRKRIDNAWTYGWIDDTNAFAEGVTFEPGEAFWVNNDGEEGVNTFNTSGAVNQKDIAFVLATDGDALMCGNCTPVSIALQDMLCPEAAANKITLQLLNGDGSTKVSYLWGRKRIENAWKYGWIDDTNEFAEGVTFKPGQGFWVNNDGTEQDDFTLTLPGVEL